MSRLLSSASHISPDCVNGEGTDTQTGTPLIFVSLRLVPCSPPLTTFHDREGPVDTASDFEHAQNLDQMSAGKFPLLIHYLFVMLPFLSVSRVFYQFRMSLSYSTSPLVSLHLRIYQTFLVMKHRRRRRTEDLTDTNEHQRRAILGLRFLSVNAIGQDVTGA